MSTLPFLPYGTPLEGADAGEWAVAILDAMPAPITEVNVYSFAGWFLREGGGGQNNPMNTTLGSQYPPINSVNVRSYPTPEIGVQETIATLDNGYAAIVADFKAGAGLQHPSSEAAAELGKWSGGGYYAITPSVVPMPTPPPPPDPYGYLQFDATVIQLPHGKNSERNVVKNYDLARPHPKDNAKELAWIDLNLEALIKRLQKNMKRAHDPNGLKDNRKWRLAQLTERQAGTEVVK